MSFPQTSLDGISLPVSISRSKSNSVRCLGTTALVFIVGMFLGMPLHAQFRTSIQGVVTDAQGAIVPGATLVLKNSATNDVQTRTSSDLGVFNFNALPASTFSLNVTSPGFKTKVLSPLRLIPEQPNAVNVQLEVGTVTESVSVNASQAPDLDQGTANIGGTIGANEIEHMPSFNRDVFQLTQLVPGINSDGAQAGGGGTFAKPGNQGPNGSSANNVPTENGPQANAIGGQYETNSISVDGISTVSAVWGGTTVITPSEESIDNVRVVSNDYDAENGRFSGAQTFVTSKSGSNDAHGSLFFALHRPGLNAYQRYNGPGSLMPGKPQSRGLLRDTQDFNQYGGSAGGPIWKSHIFAFFAYETIRNNSSNTGTGWYDTSAFDALSPTGSIAAKYLTFPGSAVSSSAIIAETCANIGLIEGVNCRTIAGQGLNIGSPLTTGLGKQDTTYASNTSPGVGNGLANVADIANYSTVSPAHYEYVQYNGRLDDDVTAKDRATFAIYWVPQSSTFYNGTQRAYNLFHHDQVNDAFSLIWNHTFSPVFLLEARANAAGWRYNEVASNSQQPVGLPQDNIGTSVGSASVNFFGAGLGSDLNQWTYANKEVATWVHGSHTIKFGGEATSLHYLNNPTGIPGYNFFNIWDFLNDAPKEEYGNFNSTTGVPGGIRQDDREFLFGAFVQDGWIARPTLTVNAGLRYSYFGALRSKQNNMNQTLFGTGTNLLTGMTVRQGGDLWTPQKWNFGPQLSFAWTPSRTHARLVVRGGYGLSFNQEEIALTANAGNNPKTANFYDFNSNNAASINPNILYGVSSDPHSLHGYAANPNAVTVYNAGNLPVGGHASLYAFGDTTGGLPTAYVEHFSLDTEYDLGHHLIATLGYQGSLAHHLVTQSQANATYAARGFALNPLVTNITYWGNEGASNDHELLATLKHNFSSQFSAEAQFAWAKSMDDGSGPYELDPYPYNPRYAYGRSDFSIGKSFKAFGVWRPVLFHGNLGWLDKIAGGWTVSGIATFHTGYGWTPIYGTGQSLYCNGCSYSNLRPIYLGGAGHSTSNDAFKSGPGVGNGVNKNFPKQVNATPPPSGATSYAGSPYFSVPDYSQAISGPTFPGVAPGLPPPPGIARNSFTGPGYRNVDATFGKAFGLPKARVIGENARLEIRADLFNLFNNLNFDPTKISNNITLANFGQDSNALGARTISFQTRFSF